MNVVSPLLRKTGASRTDNAGALRPSATSGLKVSKGVDELGASASLVPAAPTASPPAAIDACFWLVRGRPPRGQRQGAGAGRLRIAQHQLPVADKDAYFASVRAALSQWASSPVCPTHPSLSPGITRCERTMSSAARSPGESRRESCALQAFAGAPPSRTERCWSSSTWVAVAHASRRSTPTREGSSTDGTSLPMESRRW